MIILIFRKDVECYRKVKRGISGTYAFEEIFCLRSNLTNNDIISGLSRGLKTDMDFINEC